MRAASTTLHLAGVLLVSLACHREAEVRSEDYKVCSLDVSLGGGFTKIL